jgi:2-C-methyl-D-erythritol 4-phosphate cytidylyltransferase
MRVSAVILAAGSGRRMARGENKAFVSIAGNPLLSHTLRAFSLSPRISEIVLVVRACEEDRVRALLPDGLPPVSIVPGGDHRRDSAIAGVAAAGGQIVLIHDGARPFPSIELIERVVDGAIQHGACIPVLPVVDTIRPTKDDGFLGDRLLDRSRLARAQTPQGFETELIRRALALVPPDVPDDAAAVLALGSAVWTVPGEPTNLKVTAPDDLPLAEAIGERLRLFGQKRHAA